MPIVNFTTRWVESLRPPADGQIDYWDKKLHRFSLRMTASGRKTWNVYYRFHGRKRRFSLGTFPAVNLADARTRARAALSQVDGGADPAAEKIRTLRAKTFADLSKEYLEKHAKPKKKSWRNDKWMLDRHLLPRWQHVKAHDVSRPDVRALIESIAENGTTILANRVLALTSKIFAFAVARDWRVDNPCKGIERPGAEHPRERKLTPDELKTLWNVLEREDAFFKALFQLRLLTAARGGEIRHMRWQDIDLDSGWWVIPREHSKNNEPHRVPLIQEAQDVLTELKHWQDQRLRQINAGRRKKGWEPKTNSPWVFPSPRGDRPFDWEQRATARIRKTSGVDFRPHDLRRTVATGLTEHCAVDRFLLKRLLNHVDRDITGVYDRNRYDVQKRTALVSWARYLRGVVTADQQLTVVQFNVPDLGIV